MKRYLEVLDDPAVSSKEQFMLTCSALGLEIDEARYEEVVRYEVGQLSKLKKLEPMFRELPERSLWEYKKHFHLVESAGVVGGPSGVDYRRFEVRIVNAREKIFSAPVELLGDMQSMFGVNFDAELFEMLADQGGLRR